MPDHPSAQPHRKPHVALRRQRLSGLVDMASGPGLEVGPLDAAVAPRPPCDVYYSDVTDTAALRAHYRLDPDVTCAAIVEVDFPLQVAGKMRTLAEAAAPRAPYRWVIACHVIEHVPDLVGWLADAAEVLEDGGLLALVVPDRRFTFDALRPATTVGQVLQAHDRKDTVPSARAVYDYVRSAVDASAADLWAGRAPADARRLHSLDHARAMREAALRGEYVDSHVWVFSPIEFVAQVEELGDLDLCAFTIEGGLPTAPNEMEFTLVLRRLPRGVDRDQRAALRRDALAAFHANDPFVDPASGAPSGPRSMTVSDLEARLLLAKRAGMQGVRGIWKRLQERTAR